MFEILDGRERFYQWDINRKIIVKDDTIKEVHFCNGTDECSLVCEVYQENGLNVANVPNIILQTNNTIKIYGYDGESTRHTDVFCVKPRSKPADYVYTETEVKNYDTLKKYIDELIDNIIIPSGDNNCVVSKYYSIDMTTFRNYGVLDFSISNIQSELKIVISTILGVFENEVIQPLTDIPFNFLVGESKSIVLNKEDFKSVGLISPFFEAFGITGYVSFDTFAQLLLSQMCESSTVNIEYDERMEFIALNILVSAKEQYNDVAIHLASLCEQLLNMPDTKLVFEYQKQENIETQEAIYQLSAEPIINVGE